MIKILLSIALVILCSGGGWALTRKYKFRKDFFYQMSLFNARLINEVSYTKMPIAAFIEKYTFSGDFGRLLQEIKAKGTSAEGCNFSYLTQEDQSFVRDYFLMVGKSDAMSQKEYLSSIGAETERLRSESNEECKRRMNLYIRLGFLIGLIAAIVLA